MTWEALHLFPGWIVFVAGIALVLAAWTALVAAALELLIRRFRATTK